MFIEFSFWDFYKVAPTLQFFILRTFLSLTLGGFRLSYLFWMHVVPSTINNMKEIVSF